MSIGLKSPSEPAQEQQARVLRHWAESTRLFVEFPRRAVEGSIPERFEFVVCAHAERIAIQSDDQTLTYASLNEQANRLARSLISNLGLQAEPVALLFERNASAIVAILGTLKSGKTYVALDRAHPPDRLGAILQDAQVRLIITNNRNLALAQTIVNAKSAQPGKIKILNLDDLDDSIATENLGLTIAPDAFATILYTSGSTGVPKGVIQNHRNILHYIMTLTNAYRICSDDRQPQFFSHSYAISLASTFGILLNGGMLLPIDLDVLGIGKVADWLVQNQVSMLHWIPSLVIQFFSTLTSIDEQRFPKLRLLAFGGGAVAREDFISWQKHLPNAVLASTFGSTEANGVARMLFDPDSEIQEGVVPLGFPDPDKNVILVDEQGNPVEAGQTGEMLIKSDFLSPGYWGKTELTQAVFRADPGASDKRVYFSGDLARQRADGALVFVGRKDFQVKVRGYTVQISEVEAELFDLSWVKDTAVVARKREDGETRLVAYLVAKSESLPPISKVRAALNKKLPDYMIPSVFVFLDALPYTPNGKVDRQALPEPSATRPELGNQFVAPQNIVQTRLAQIWEDVLEIHPIGIQDSFVDLGGDSLDYLSLLIQIENEFGKTMPSTLQTPTIEQMAQVLEKTDPIPTALPISDPSPSLWSFLQRGLSLLLSSPRVFLGGVQRVIIKYLRRGPVFFKNQIPYSSGVRFLAWICDQHWIQETLFRHPVQLLRQVIPLVIPGTVDQAKIIHQSLATSVWGKWKLLTLAQYPANEFDQWVQVKGFEYFHQAHQEGRGVVLVRSHLASAGLLRIVLHRSGYDDGYWVYGIAPSLFRQSRIPTSVLYAGQLYNARQTLQRGGYASVVADGGVGTSPGITLPFFGRQRTFKTGFAELALVSRAIVVPVTVSIDITGHAELRFMPQLEIPGSDRQQQIESLVRQYAEILRKEWLEKLGNVSWRELEAFLKLPLVDQ